LSSQLQSNFPDDVMTWCNRPYFLLQHNCHANLL